MSNALTTIDRSTGEVVTTPTFDMTGYLSDVTSPAAFASQQQLAAAYDHAVKALIGPNDVQQESGREFKKKSAWRKLARHFRISTSVVDIHKQWTEDGDFIATVTVRGTAPWGQHADAVGACATSEATGRRVITIADALATAETRATNRATSNLIAMGEVSAEEMPKGRPTEDRGQARSSVGSRNTAGTIMPGAPAKWDGNGGKPLAEVPTSVLSAFIGWVEKQSEPSDNLTLCVANAKNIILDRENQGDPAPADDGFDTVPAGLRDQSDDLPF